MHLVFVFLQKINLSFIDSEKVQFHFFVFFFWFLDDSICSLGFPFSYQRDVTFSSCFFLLCVLQHFNSTSTVKSFAIFGFNAFCVAFKSGQEFLSLPSLSFLLDSFASASGSVLYWSILISFLLTIRFNFFFRHLLSVFFFLFLLFN